MSCDDVRQLSIRGARVRRSCETCKKGFSLVELMLVIVIIGLLAGVVTINVRNYLIKAKRNIARQDIASLEQALNAFWSRKDRYPTNDEGLAILSAPDDETGEPFLSGSSGASGSSGSAIPKDPWGREYQYVCPGQSGPFEVICFGADGREGGMGADGDISSDEVGQ